MPNDDSQAQVEVNVESDLYYEQVLKLYRLCSGRIERRLDFLLLAKSLNLKKLNKMMSNFFKFHNTDGFYSNRNN